MKAGRGAFRVQRCLSSKPQAIFDHSLKKRQRDWSLSRAESADYDYLRTFSAERLVDRLDDISRDFETALDFGCHRGHILKAISKQNELSVGRGVGGIKKLFQSDISQASQSDLTSNSDLISAEFLPLSCLETEYKDNVLAPNQYNLVMSSLWLHWANDIPSLLRSILLSLQPDGVFLGCMLGGSTLEEFRHAFYLAETERKGGVSPHMSPLVRPSDAAALLQGAGFALPTIDTDTVTVSSLPLLPYLLLA
jgi:NADH dehydrogenase [ubiquinone] 1 alpha subcomplex assembly factor 5